MPAPCHSRCSESSGNMLAVPLGRVVNGSAGLEDGRALILRMSSAGIAAGPRAVICGRGRSVGLYCNLTSTGRSVGLWCNPIRQPPRRAFCRGCRATHWVSPEGALCMARLQPSSCASRGILTHYPCTRALGGAAQELPLFPRLSVEVSEVSTLLD